jgi:hypothetical protein
MLTKEQIVATLEKLHGERAQAEAMFVQAQAQMAQARDTMIRAEGAINATKYLLAQIEAAVSADAEQPAKAAEAPLPQPVEQEAAAAA